MTNTAPLDPATTDTPASYIWGGERWHWKRTFVSRVWKTRSYWDCQPTTERIDDCSDMWPVAKAKAFAKEQFEKFLEEVKDFVIETKIDDKKGFYEVKYREWPADKKLEWPATHKSFYKVTFWYEKAELNEEVA